MERRVRIFSASAALLLAVSSAPPAFSLDEQERLWLVGTSAFTDGLYPLARRVLERFVADYPNDARMPEAMMLVGRTRLNLGDNNGALEAFRRAQTLPQPSGQPLEAKLWEGEALFRLKRYSEARVVYDEVFRADVLSSSAPDALYGLGMSELELKHPQEAATALRDLVQTWPDHRLAGAATFSLATALVELKRYNDALPLLINFPTTYPGHRLIPNSQFMLGWTRIQMGDRRAGIADLRVFAEKNPSHELVPEARRLAAEVLTRTDREERLERERQERVERERVERERAERERVERERVERERQDRERERVERERQERAERAERERQERVALLERERQERERTDKEKAEREKQEVYEATAVQTTTTPEALYDAASLAGRLGRTKDQEATWRKIVADYPKHPLGCRAALDLAALAFRRKDWKESATFARVAAASDDESVKAEGWLQAGEAELKLKRLTPAAEAFEEVVGLKDVEADVRYRAFAGLGLVREEQKEWQAALEAYEAAALTPDATLRDWAQQRAAVMKGRATTTTPQQRPRRGSGS